jgi:hypothetical protein
MVLSLMIILLIVLVDILFISNEIKKYFLYALKIIKKMARETRPINI